MKFSRILAALLFVSLNACSDKDGGNPAPNYPAIPADISLNKGSLQNLSDAEFAEGLRLFKAVANVADVGRHLLTMDADEHERMKRQEKYDALTAEQRAFVDTQKANCEVTEEKKDPQWTSEKPRSGDSTTFGNKNVASGPNCDIEAANIMNGLFTLLGVQNEANFELGGRFAISYNSSIKSAADQQLMGYRHVTVSGAIEGRQSIVNYESTDYYHTGTLIGSAEVLKDDIGRVELRWSTEQLTKGSNNMDVTILRIELTHGGKTYELTSHIRKKDGVNAEEHFLGDRQLSAEEGNSLRDILFTMD